MQNCLRKNPPANSLNGQNDSKWPDLMMNKVMSAACANGTVPKLGELAI